jgi:hypothetical protein
MSESQNWTSAANDRLREIDPVSDLAATAWLKHIQKANAALSNLTPERMALLKADESFSKGAVKLRCRPRVTQHGGATRVAVKD